ncbi:MAG TPA: tetraacyldisaccharide 4'-kinase [Vicinamibacterales bacterium]
MPQPFLRLLSDVYGSVALARRRWYISHPAARRRLDRPVISIGNLSVGGTGKTPLVAAIARLLVEMGERPSILSRGYKRRSGSDEVVIVSDGHSVLADVEHAGDEPYMLARAVPESAVVVSTSRHAAGRVAETRLGCTVHLLDDGFQHFRLERDIDLLIVTSADRANPYPLPLGRLREPFSVARSADAVFVGAGEVAGDVDGRPVFQMNRTIEAPRPIPSDIQPGLAEPVSVNLPGPVFAMAGIANPQRFFDDLQGTGWHLVGTRSFADHHQFSTSEIVDVLRTAASAGAKAVLTTEKDVVRFSGLSPRPPSPEPRIPILWTPLRVMLDPAFGPWLRKNLGRPS